MLHSSSSEQLVSGINVIYRMLFLLVVAVASSGTALAAGCSEADRGIQELNALTNDLTDRVKTLQAAHQQLKDAELCQIATRLKQAIARIDGCVSPADALKGKLKEVEAAADAMMGQSCNAP